MKRLMTIVGLVLGLIGPLSGAFAQERVKIASSTDSISYMPLYAARLLGHFAEVGVQVEVLRIDTGPKAMSAVIGGDVDIILGATTTPLNARKAGVDVVLFAPVTTQYSSNIIISKKWATDHKLSGKSSYAEKLAAIKGLTLGITGPGGGTDQIVRYMASAAGINPDRDMTLVTLGSDANTMMAAFSQGRVDGLAISSPTSNVAVQNFGGMTLFNVGVGEVKALDGFFQSGFAALRPWLSKNQTAAVKLVKGVQMGLDSLRDPSRTVRAREMIQKEYYSKLDPAVFDEAWKDQILALPKTVNVTREMIEGIINFNNQFSKDKLDLAMANVAFTDDIAQQALKELPAGGAKP